MPPLSAASLAGTPGRRGSKRSTRSDDCRHRLASNTPMGNLSASLLGSYERSRRCPNLKIVQRIVASTAVTIAAYCFFAPGAAKAQVPFVDEFKIGVLAHDVGFLTHHVETGADVNIEALFTPPDLLRVIGSPRPHLGADINTSGNTSDGYFGLTWGVRPLQL